MDECRRLWRLGWAVSFLCACLLATGTALVYRLWFHAAVMGGFVMLALWCVIRAKQMWMGMLSRPQSNRDNE